MPARPVRRPAEPAPVAVRAALDLEHLGQYTLGDSGFLAELLGLFRVQMRQQQAALAACQAAGTWVAAAHTLKGAARAMGAWEVADIAARLEETRFDDADERAGLLGTLEAAVARCEEAIAAQG